MYIDVYVAYPLEQSFTYALPPGVDVQPGQRVLVNFAGRKIVAAVIARHDRKPEGYAVKEITSVIDETPIFGEALVDLCHFVAASYLAAPGEVMTMALPSGQKPSDRFKVPFKEAPPVEKELTGEQRQVYSDIVEESNQGNRKHLIFGVTGSGKTEVYIELARKVLKENKSVIFLVPEISLSSQIYERLYRVFGDELILYHSQLTKNQRFHNWLKFYRGESKIAIGTRSSVFLQCPDLGLMVIDEEQDGSYKEHSTPRYNTRRIALYRSNTEGALLIMGSATPSIESYYAAEAGILKLHKLKERFGGATLPDVRIIDAQSARGRETVTSQLKLYMNRAMEQNEQVILLLNRRGFAPFVLCNSCSEVITCPHCSISMNYHRGNLLLCHYCGYTSPLGKKCPACGAEELVKVGAGTQRLEEEVAEIFPKARLYRLDQDTARKKKSSYELLEMMEKGEIDVLMGTQMVAKGFDFSRVSVIGILLADLGLNLPDFRATERVYSLLTQVAGRSGRGETGGIVLLQALDTEHPLFEMVQRQDYEGFYRQEIEFRKSLGYPPFGRLVRLLVRGSNEQTVVTSINAASGEVRKRLAADNPGVSVLGPAAAPLERIGGNFRHHIILKGKDIGVLRGLAKVARESINDKSVYLEIDVDPVDLL